MKLKLFKGIRDYRQNKTAGTGEWFTTSKDVAFTYSDRVVSKTIESDNVKVVDFGGKFWNGGVSTDSLAKKYKDYDVIVFKDVVDVGPNFMQEYLKGIFPKSLPKEKLTDYYKRCFTANTVVVNRKKYFDY